MTDQNQQLDEFVDEFASDIEDEWQRPHWDRLGKILFVAVGTYVANVFLEKAWDRKFRNESEVIDYIDAHIVE
jgi:hypothetical protein